MRIKSVHPGKIHDRIGFAVAIPQADARILRRKSFAGNVRILNVIRKRIVRNLVVVFAQRSHQPQLVRGIEIEDQRAKAAIAVSAS